jgi:hypothetical protein
MRGMVHSPRAQLAHVVVASALAALLGAAPAAAWDASTQAATPAFARAHQASAWTGFGAQIKRTLRRLGRAYLPARNPSEATPAPTALAAAKPLCPPPTASAGPPVRRRKLE